MPSMARASELSDWFNLKTAPFIPIPEIVTDPDSGQTFGIIATWLQTDSQGDIHRIVAPVVDKNNYFGYGAGISVYDYPSPDRQWSVYGYAEQRVEREVDYHYFTGLQRESSWSFTARAHYYRDGTPRFFGVGNNTTMADETNYTSEQELLDAQPGWNITHALQLAYLLRLQNVDVSPGPLRGVTSIERRFARRSLGANRMALNRLMLVYDTRDNLYLPTRGVELVAYGGFASRRGFLNPSLYSEAGVDARAFVPFGTRTVLALHSALRYLPEAHRLPFWAYSSIGGDRSYIGGDQPLRGFGAGRFSGRNSFSFTAELRETVASFTAVSSHVDLQLAPFIDMGRVFPNAGTNVLTGLHKVYGLGIRGIAPPFIVGYIDIGFGTEGAAIFTGINYPF
jgi:outer membrane protein assembly factor BamA